MVLEVEQIEESPLGSVKDIEKVADIPNGVSDGLPSLSDDISATINSIADLLNLVKWKAKKYIPKERFNE